MNSNHLILAGGGHTHALLLLRWAMKPKLKPKCLITLISRKSSSLYSGMVPGLISGKYKWNECLFNLDHLARKAGVSFVRAEILSLNISNRIINLSNRPPINFDQISLDVGSESRKLCFANAEKFKNNPSVMFIKPLEDSLEWINKLDNKANKLSSALTVVGSGLTAIEVALALRERWPEKKIQLQSYDNKKIFKLKEALINTKIKIIPPSEELAGPVLFCTGSTAPLWLEESGLPVDSKRRVLTLNTFEVINHPYIFAVGDCGVIQNNPRPSSGVWAVKAAKPLAKNLLRSINGLPLLPWRPQGKAMQLVGATIEERKGFVAWAFWGDVILGPSNYLGLLKEFLDKRFIAMFDLSDKMEPSSPSVSTEMACRGCAAKLPAKNLQNALKEAHLVNLVSLPEDCAVVESPKSDYIHLQSVDGFPALINDPWLNGRLTALHACSDIWAKGASINSAQAIITLPIAPNLIQEKLLSQSLLGIQSALEPQGAKLIGGHTLETRSRSNDSFGLNIQISIAVNGLLSKNESLWPINGLRPGDILLLSRGIGSGVIFFAAMYGALSPYVLDEAIMTLNNSQYELIKRLRNIERKSSEKNLIHACTDITGFGLLGHLAQMLETSNQHREKSFKPFLSIDLDLDCIPTLKGALNLLDKGFVSTLSPANSQSFRFLIPQDKTSKTGINVFVDSKIIEANKIEEKEYKSLFNLIIDPQTCGPLLVACEETLANDLVAFDNWTRIGNVN